MVFWDYLSSDWNLDPCPLIVPHYHFGTPLFLPRYLSFIKGSFDWIEWFTIHDCLSRKSGTTKHSKNHMGLFSITVWTFLFSHPRCIEKKKRIRIRVLMSRDISTFWRDIESQHCVLQFNMYPKWLVSMACWNKNYLVWFMHHTSKFKVIIEVFLLAWQLIRMQLTKEENSF